MKDEWTPEAIGEAWRDAKRRSERRLHRAPLAGRPPAQLLVWCRSFLGRDLCSDARRCSGCGAHVATQGHQPHCPLGPCGSVALTADGLRWNSDSGARAVAWMNRPRS